MKKKYFLISILFFTPLIALGATFERDLYFGMRQDSDVARLQTFLISQHVYEGPQNGNFFSLTRDAVVRFQKQQGIEPSQGYLGPRSRARADALIDQSSGSSVSTGNEQSKATAIAMITAQIQALQAQLIALQTQIKNQPTPPAPQPVPPPVPVPVATSTPQATSTPTVVPPTVALVKAVKFSGESTSTFPSSSVVPFKIGDITVKNDTDANVLFNQVVLDIVDKLDSPLNRGKEATLRLRDASAEGADTISTQKFTFDTNALRDSTDMHRYQVGISYPILMKPGEQKVVALWLENFEIVNQGSLNFRIYDIQASDTINRVGSFNFLLTK